MTIIYRTDDLSKWGTGIGRRLHASEVDVNFWELDQRLATLEAAPGQPAAIESFEVVGTVFYVHLTDDTTLGPYELPVYAPVPRGEWVPLTSYSFGDWFTANGNLYAVNLDHNSASSFDPDATDGSGHDLYMLLLEPPGNSLPTGGATGQVLTKSSGLNYAVTWSWKYPSGTTGQYLRQKSNTQDDVEFTDIQADEVEFTPVTGSSLTSINVADTLEELSVAVAAAVEGALAENILYTPNTGSGLTDDNVQDALNTLGARSKLGRQTMWIPAAAMTPLITNGAAAGTTETATYKNIIKTLDFDASTAESAQFDVAMPKSWDGGDVYFKLFWSHPSTTTNFDVVWKIYAGSLIPTSVLDINVSTNVSVTDTGGFTNSLYVSDETPAITIPNSSFGSMIFFRVQRDAANGSDNLAVDAKLHGIQLYYTTNAATDD